MFDMKHAILFNFTGSAADLSTIDLTDYLCRPPNGQQWKAIGLKDEPFDPKLFNFERQERVLPSAVINREAEKRFADYEDHTGRKPGKKARAEIKSNVIDDLLPKAFIRVSHIEVTISHGLLIVWTSSIAKADEVVSLIVGILTANDFEAQIEAKPLKPGLELVALGKHGALLPGRSAVLTGPDKQKVRVKALAVESHRVQPLIEVDSYRVNEIEVALGEDCCTLTDKGVVKNIELHGSDRDDEAGSWLATNFIRRMIDAVDEDEL